MKKYDYQMTERKCKNCKYKNESVKKKLSCFLIKIGFVIIKIILFGDLPDD